MTLGGISKASKGINLSEDIFGGFNFVLRGGKATQAEYMQVKNWWSKMRLAIWLFYLYMIPGEAVPVTIIGKYDMQYHARFVYS